MVQNIRLFVFLSATFLVVSCSSFQSIEQSQNSSQSTRSHSRNNNALNALNQVYERYKGSPYKYGGTDKNGFDCSGFIGVAFQEALNTSLPRTTEQLASGGQAIRRDQLQAGDIIIFKTSVKQLHAGIYTENGKFIHASTSNGVIESQLRNDYWQQRYIKARRYH